MKRILTILLVLVICLSFSACKDEAKVTETLISEAPQECSEQEIRMLIENNMNCYFLFYVSPLPNTGQRDSDGYYKATEDYLANYSELEKLVNDTYTKSCAQNLLLNYPGKSTPLYKNKNSAIFVNPDIITEVEYDILWEDDYTIEFTENSTTKCSFKLETVDLNSNPYKTEGSAVFENGKWVLTDIIH